MPAPSRPPRRDPGRSGTGPLSGRFRGAARMTPAPAPHRARRILARLVAAGLAALGALSALLGAGLSLIGLCCGGPALVAAAAAGTTAAAAPGGAAAWPFLAIGAALITAAWLLHRCTARPGCCPPRTPASPPPPPTA
jgi:hypothetical protein